MQGRSSRAEPFPPEPGNHLDTQVLLPPGIPPAGPPALEPLWDLWTLQMSLFSITRHLLCRKGVKPKSPQPQPYIHGHSPSSAPKGTSFTPTAAPSTASSVIHKDTGHCSSFGKTSKEKVTCKSLSLFLPHCSAVPCTPPALPAHTDWHNRAERKPSPFQYSFLTFHHPNANSRQTEPSQSSREQTENKIWAIDQPAGSTLVLVHLQMPEGQSLPSALPQELLGRCWSCKIPLVNHDKKIFMLTTTHLFTKYMTKTTPTHVCYLS